MLSSANECELKRAELEAKRGVRTAEYQRMGSFPQCEPGPLQRRSISFLAPAIEVNFSDPI